MGPNKVLCQEDATGGIRHTVLLLMRLLLLRLLLLWVKPCQI
jgi:hypothetical protein